MKLPWVLLLLCIGSLGGAATANFDKEDMAQDRAALPQHVSLTFKRHAYAATTTVNAALSADARHDLRASAGGFASTVSTSAWALLTHISKKISTLLDNRKGINAVAPVDAPADSQSVTHAANDSLETTDNTSAAGNNNANSKAAPNLTDNAASGANPSPDTTVDATSDGSTHSPFMSFWHEVCRTSSAATSVASIHFAEAWGSCHTHTVRGLSYVGASTSAAASAAGSRFAKAWGSCHTHTVRGLSYIGASVSGTWDQLTMWLHRRWDFKGGANDSVHSLDRDAAHYQPVGSSTTSVAPSSAAQSFLAPSDGDTDWIIPQHAFQPDVSTPEAALGLPTAVVTIAVVLFPCCLLACFWAASTTLDCEQIAEKLRQARDLIADLREQLASQQAAHATSQAQLKSEEVAHKALQHKFDGQFILVSRSGKVEVKTETPFGEDGNLLPNGLVRDLILSLGGKRENVSATFKLCHVEHNDNVAVRKLLRDCMTVRIVAGLAAYSSGGHLGAVMNDSVWACIPTARYLPRDTSAYTETLTEERRQEIIKAMEDPQCSVCFEEPEIGEEYVTRVPGCTCSDHRLSKNLVCAKCAGKSAAHRPYLCLVCHSIPQELPTFKEYPGEWLRRFLTCGELVKFCANMDEAEFVYYASPEHCKKLQTLLAAKEKRATKDEDD